MPYMIVPNGDKFKVHKKGPDGKAQGPALGTHPSRHHAAQQIRALYANESTKPKKKEIDFKAEAGKPTSSEDYAVVPDPDKPSTWKMPIHDRKHLGLAIAALGSDARAPHGHAADLSPEDRKQALSRIHARIGRLANDEADKADLHARLAKHGKKSFFGGGWSPVNEASTYPTPISYDDQDDGDDYLGDTLTPKLDPDDPRVEYEPMGGDSTNACANCAFFDADDAACRLVAGDIVAPGLCNLWLRELTDDEEDEADAVPVSMVGAGKEVQPGLLATIKTAIKQVFGIEELDIAESDLTSGFKMFGLNNEFWAALYSNNAQDRDKEWFAQKSHDEFIDRIDRSEVPMPKLDFWHCKAYHGQTEWIGRVGHVTVAVGTFDDSPLAEAMKEYYAEAEPGDLLTSFGYFYPRSALVDGVYYAYNAFEISPLPAQVAANPYTGFTSLEEFKEMSVSAQKQKALERLVGAKRAQLILGAADTKSKELDEVASSFKSLGNPLEAKVDALADAVMILVGRKVKTDDPVVETGRQGQPVDEEDQNNAEDEPDLDEDDDENIGRLNKQIAKLKRQLKAAQAANEDDGEDEEDGEDDTPPAKKSRRKSRTPETGLKELATGFKTLNDALAQVSQALIQINQKQTALENGINQVAKEIYNPVPASRSPYTVVPPSDPAAEALAAKMMGGAGQNLPPNQQQEQIAMQDMAQFIGLPTAFRGNGNGHQG